MGPLPLKPIPWKSSFRVILLCTITGRSLHRVDIFNLPSYLKVRTTVVIGGHSGEKQLLRRSKADAPFGVVVPT
ncbi:hypothetical protein PVK06_009009 [Gossypium arboreum]|uniref:Uncharacterized protein n=1 Tax=Gossypium arboreum TaxID=29729 RepID=A0ABR0QLC0_GOSAR|nr:hypothetical protein PVK06_009009 [Gossypium arboreum]